MLMATTNIKSSNDTSFYLDPGCSTHMTRKEEWFISLNDLSQRRVGLVDLAVSSQKALAEFFFRDRDGKDKPVEFRPPAA
ncbi:hypothetical protein ACSQ67_024205 [Phaseolus vulgaris]